MLKSALNKNIYFCLRISSQPFEVIKEAPSCVSHHVNSIYMNCLQHLLHILLKLYINFTCTSLYCLYIQHDYLIVRELKYQSHCRVCYVKGIGSRVIDTLHYCNINTRFVSAPHFAFQHNTRLFFCPRSTIYVVNIPSLIRQNKWVNKYTVHSRFNIVVTWLAF